MKPATFFTYQESGGYAEQSPPAHLRLSDQLAEAAGRLVQQVQRSLVVLHNGHHGVGAGIIWAQGDGRPGQAQEYYILTNQHVIAHGRNVRAAVEDGAEYATQVVAQDEEVDLALLRIQAQGLPVAQIGDSRRLRPGQLVMAVGHPWGQRGVVTAGLVSGLLKAQTRGPRGSVDVIRSDARLAPGNSGGPLVDATGAVVGINTMIIGGDQGIALAGQVACEFVAQALKK